MQDVKDTMRSTVKISGGRFYKVFRGPNARERFDNEILVLRYLESRGCDFVPRVLEVDESKLMVVLSSCGSKVEYLDNARRYELFSELLTYGVRHDDPETRNITYRMNDGRFCIIDFEFATIVEPLPGKTDV